MSRPQDDRNQEATVYLGNLDERCTDALIWELMLQAGPVVNVHLPKDRISMAHQGFGFCEFLTEEDAEYACKIMNQIKLWGKPIRVNKASSDKKQLDVGANLFIGSLDENVDERLLYDTFSAFGMMATTAKIARDPQTGQSKGYGFVSYTDFESADAAIESMNGQFLMNKPITVQYAFKKDGKGERHGTAAERLLAAQARKNNALPLAPRPPAAAYGTAPPIQGFTGPYQGQFAGALAAPPPPPPGFTPMPMQAPGPGAVHMPPMGMSIPAGMPPPTPPGGVPMFNPGHGYPPPPPPGFPAMGGAPMMAPPPPSGVPPYMGQ
ncbi:spliceosome-associated protein [Lactarius tabidus]